MRKISIKRLYDPPAPEDGLRVLVDRLWPRGISREKAEIHHWAKEIAPSTELRKWFHHDPERWNGFQDRYRAELEDRAEMLRELVAMDGDRPLTLLYSAKDRTHNQAVVLKEMLERL